MPARTVERSVISSLILSFAFALLPALACGRPWTRRFMHSKEMFNVLIGVVSEPFVFIFIVKWHEKIFQSFS
jgi:hypothetical protein